MTSLDNAILPRQACAERACSDSVLGGDAAHLNWEKDALRSIWICSARRAAHCPSASISRASVKPACARARRTCSGRLASGLAAQLLLPICLQKTGSLPDGLAGDRQPARPAGRRGAPARRSRRPAGASARRRWSRPRGRAQPHRSAARRTATHCGAGRPLQTQAGRAGGPRPPSSQLSSAGQTTSACCAVECADKVSSISCSDGRQQTQDRCRARAWMLINRIFLYRMAEPQNLNSPPSHSFSSAGKSPRRAVCSSWPLVRTAPQQGKQPCSGHGASRLARCGSTACAVPDGVWLVCQAWPERARHAWPNGCEVSLTSQPLVDRALDTVCGPGTCGLSPVAESHRRVGCYMAVTSSKR